MVDFVCVSLHAVPQLVWFVLTDMSSPFWSMRVPLSSHSRQIAALFVLEAWLLQWPWKGQFTFNTDQEHCASFFERPRAWAFVVWEDPSARKFSTAAACDHNEGLRRQAEFK